MHRFYVPPEISREESFVLPESEAHHATQVLRLRTGEEAEVLDGKGSRIRVRVEQVERRGLRVEVREVERQIFPAATSRCVLVISLLKGKAFELAIEKVTELGVDEIIAIPTERSVSIIRPDEAVRKVQTWQSTAIAAAKQCGRVWIPEIRYEPRWRIAPPGFSSTELSLVASLQKPVMTIRQAILASHDSIGRFPKGIACWIGPEGDWTPEELEVVQAGGARSVTLGPCVLRAETAAIASVAVIQDISRDLTPTQPYTCQTHSHP